MGGLAQVRGDVRLSLMCAFVSALAPSRLYGFGAVFTYVNCFQIRFLAFYLLFFVRFWCCSGFLVIF